jgi:ATP-dependent protease ClpP protease subunit
MRQLECRAQTGPTPGAEYNVEWAVHEDSFEVFLHGIVGDEMDGSDSLTIAKVFSDNRGKPMHLRVNSAGGLAYHGIAIYNIIDAHDGPTTGTIEGMAGSAASLAVIACDTVQCHKTAVFAPHYALIGAFGHQPEIRDALEALEVLDAALEEVYAEASGRSVEQVKQDLKGPNGDGTRFSAEDALAAGYVDEVIEHNKNKGGEFSHRRNENPSTLHYQTALAALSAPVFDKTADLG